MADSVRTVRANLAIYLLILAGIVYALSEAVQYGSAGTVPLMVGIPVAVLVLFQMIRLIRSEEPLGENTDSIDEFQESPEDDETEQNEEQIDHGDIARIIAWPTLYIIGIYILGFVISTLAFLYLFPRVYGGESRVRSAAYAVISTALVWFVFIYLLDIGFAPGLAFSL